MMHNGTKTITTKNEDDKKFKKKEKKKVTINVYVENISLFKKKLSMAYNIG